ncbi:MAG: DUF5615 family PIN-like protein [Planctomycetes bacterium]|jgi:hypothetical protein|nr:DUF5615 family PIN-like protein [Planctomycetota bacterium]
MLLYADEDFPFPAVEVLRNRGHDVVTVQKDGWSAKPDCEVLARAHELGRSVITYNRRHYERLHRQGQDHSGIASAKQDDDHAALAGRIDAALAGLQPGRWCIRVNRGPLA